MGVHCALRMARQSLSSVFLLIAAFCNAHAAAPDLRFAVVDRTVRSAVEQQQVPGMGLSIYGAQGNLVFEQMYGDFSADRRIPIASASKLAAGLTILRLIDQGRLSLDSTTGQLLGWKGPRAAITLKHLLAFTSGLPPKIPCAFDPAVTLADCVATISNLELTAPPGTRFDYGNTHLHVAARMAEVVTGQGWNALFGVHLREPLGLGPEVVFHTLPRRAAVTANPFIAAGLRMTMHEYAEVLDLQFHRGVHRGTRLIGDAWFTAQGTEPYPQAVIGDSPSRTFGLNYHYGLTSWLECPAPAVDCGVLSWPGIFGFMPWVDRPGGYYAILAMDVADPARAQDVKLAVDLAQKLRPLIREALDAPR
jgi:serine-type D-Ala-D-Ala carboxypeptidase/endopeptidase